MQRDCYRLKLVSSTDAQCLIFFWRWTGCFGRRYLIHQASFLMSISNFCVKFQCPHLLCLPMKFHSLSLVYFLVDYWIMHFSFLCANRTYFMFNHFNSIINSLELGLLFNLQYWLKGPLKIPGSFHRMPGKQQQEQQLIAAMGVSRLKVSMKRSFVHCWSRLLFSPSYYFIGMGTGDVCIIG